MKVDIPIRHPVPVVYIGKAQVPGRHSRFDWEVSGRTDCVVDDEPRYLLTNAGSETGERFQGWRSCSTPSLAAT